MTASWREELITAPDLYISIHVCLRESDCGTGARANAAHASAPPPDPLLLGGSRGEDKRAIDLQGTLERCIKIRYYGPACCRVSSAGGLTRSCVLLSNLCDAASPEEADRSHIEADTRTSVSLTDGVGWLSSSLSFQLKSPSWCSAT